MPVIHLMIGLPASGKSTFTEGLSQALRGSVILSTDNFIEEKAATYHSTYNEMWPKYIDAATKDLNHRFQAAIDNRNDIIVDRTNLTVKSRAKLLNRLNGDYHRIAHVFIVSDEELTKRLQARVITGKVVPQSVIDQMKKDYELPSLVEGFDEIQYHY